MHSSINQNTFSIAPYVASESEAHDDAVALQNLSSPGAVVVKFAALFVFILHVYTVYTSKNMQQQFYKQT